MPRDDDSEFLGSLLESFPGFVTRIDSRDRITYINKTAEGIDIDDVIGRDVFDYVLPEHRGIARDCFERVRSTGLPASYEADAGSGDRFAHYVNYVSAVYDAHGTVGLCIVGTDVTERRRREDALRESRDRLKLAVEATGLAMWFSDLDSGTNVWDERMRALLGREHAVSHEQFVATCVHPNDRDRVDALRARAFEEGGFRTETLRIVRPDGEVRWLLASAIAHRDQDGRPLRVLGGAIDITDRHSMEQQLRQAQKMQAVGNLTAGIAHNFNNILMVLMPTLELLEKDVSAVNRPLLDDARTATRNAADLVQRLMTFAGQTQAVAHEAHAIGRIVADAVNMMRRTVGRGVTIRVREEDVPTVVCDPAGIEQVVVNLVLNARDAFEASRRDEPVIDVSVDVSVRHHPDSREEAPVRWVGIRVRDNGSGMVEAVRSQVFEPFFTTKQTQGTGLGLSTSYAVVRDHGGWIECASSPGEGTEMSVFLPAADVAPPAPLRSEPRTSRPRILLVDDDEAVRSAIATVLREQYEVVTAASVLEAVAVVDRDRSYALSLVEHALPGNVSGVLVPRLRQALPGAPVLYFTGGHIDDVDAVDGVIRKPVLRATLLAQIAEALQHGRPAEP